MPRLNEYVKVAEAARFLGVSQKTLRKWADAGLIPMRLLPTSGYRLFDRDDLQVFLAKTTRPTVTKKKAR